MLPPVPAAPVPDVVVGLTPAALDATRPIWPEDARLLDWRMEKLATGSLVGREALRLAFRRLSAAIDEAMATGQFLPRALPLLKVSPSAA